MVRWRVARVHCSHSRSVTVLEFSLGLMNFFVVCYVPHHHPGGIGTGIPGRHRIDLYPCDPLRFPLQTADFLCPVPRNFPTKKKFECVVIPIYMAKEGSHGYNDKNGRTNAAPFTYFAPRPGKPCAIAWILTIDQRSNPLRDPIYGVCAIEESWQILPFPHVRLSVEDCRKCPDRIRALHIIYDVNRIFRVPRLQKRAALSRSLNMRLPHSRRGPVLDHESGIFAGNPALESVSRLLAI